MDPLMDAESRRALASDIVHQVERHVGFVTEREAILHAIEAALADHLGRAPTRIRPSEVVPVLVDGRPPDLGGLVDRRIAFAPGEPTE